MVFRIVVGGVILALVVAGGYWFLQPPVVAVIRPESGPVSERLVATGRVSSNQRVNLGFLVVGTVIAVEVDEGDVVQAGQTLVRLEDAEAQAMVRLAEASLQQAQAQFDRLAQVGQPEAAMNAVQAEANVNLARRELERAQPLRRDGFLSDAEWQARQDAVDLADARRQVTRQELDSQQAGGSEYRLLDAQVAAAQASLDQARATLAHSRLTTPIVGRVLQRLVEAGDVVQPGVTLLALAGADLNRIELSLNEQQTGRIAVNQSALVSVDAYPDRTFAATVSFIGPRIDPQRAILPVRLRIDDPPDYLKADMTASVDIQIAQISASLTLPNSTIVYLEPGLPVVFVLEDGVVVQRQVTLGMTGDDRVELREGVSVGDRVVADPNTVRPGQRATPQELQLP
ncbi:efflux RND transporter periplasmic adaptor subunit [Saccharospirillum impatiens]|uniref:efflux RND transporter periplasmic adaptor subunit n=1 Tax=Saccharospirillum impatiens TaxID=169438 RepID=UPI0003F7DDC9|nr:efflux RND transporter periplasmic adaptor subunit [Saccharospirillum impatiens]